jgi:hypothetical protein
MIKSKTHEAKNKVYKTHGASFYLTLKKSKKVSSDVISEDTFLFLLFYIEKGRLGDAKVSPMYQLSLD